MYQKWYVCRKNKAYWCGVLQLVAAIANILPLLAFLLVPRTGSSQVQSTKGSQVQLCDANRDSKEEDCTEQDESPFDTNKIIALSCFFVCKLCAGLASQSYWTLGIAYMDDNVKTRNTVDYI